ncbi:hypothetical protein J1N35_013980 [Gossypium stocksii]|uniref:Uncharacterized protein n=1 Tax=Gossypium stocksii TaxID=47602 RepID=A0A9D3VV07_9ROSI|nr:hypothetical protein J1N35_013980 [Gossypium stocksii]
MSYASVRDSNLVKGNVEYYGLLTDIIELDYYGKWKVVLFRGDWADVNTARMTILRRPWVKNGETIKEVSSSQKVGRLQLFEIVHRKKDGSPMTSKAGEIMEKLKEKNAEYEAVASTGSSVNHEDIDNRIITEVLGPERDGRVRFQGFGVTPTQYFGSSSQQYMPSGSQAQVEVQRLKDQIAHMQASTDEQIAEVQRKYEELQQKLIADAAAREVAAAAREVEVAAREVEAAAMAAEQSRKYDELQLQLQEMMKMFQQSQKPPS